MIFGDGAAALVIGPAAPGEQTDIEVLQTYAGGPVSEVNSIIWPNPEFDNNITVYGPEVRSLAGRYLKQMIDELQAQSDPDGAAPTLLDSIDLIVPHQANKTMVIKLAGAAGIAPDQLYFNIETVGNTSAASIPLAIADAKNEGVITEPLRVFAPGFGAGAPSAGTPCSGSIRPSSRRSPPRPLTPRSRSAPRTRRRRRTTSTSRSVDRRRAGEQCPCLDRCAGTPVKKGCLVSSLELVVAVGLAVLVVTAGVQVPPTCAGTPTPSNGNVAARRSSPCKRPWKHCRASSRTSAPTTRSPISYAQSTTGGCGSCKPTNATRPPPTVLRTGRSSTPTMRVALLGRKHDTLVRLRDRDEIDDNVLQQVQAALDLEWVAVDRHRRET